MPPDPVLMVLSIPPKCAVSQVVVPRGNERRKLAEQLPQAFAHVALENLAPKLRAEEVVIFALPLRVT